jgi:hypothetical protein
MRQTTGIGRSSAAPRQVQRRRRPAAHTRIEDRWRGSILPPQDGYLLLDEAKFPAAFAGDVSPEAASFMADSQVPWGVEALSGAVPRRP